MKVSYKNSIVTINTGIKLSTIKNHGGTLKIKDDKGNDLYVVFYDESPMASGRLTDKMFPVNGVDNEGYAVLNVPTPIGAPLDEVKRNLGAVLIAAEEALPQISALVADFEGKVNSIFEAVEADMATPQDTPQE